MLSKIMSPAALTELHWTRVPAVVIFGCFVADDDGEHKDCHSIHPGNFVRPHRRLDTSVWRLCMCLIPCVMQPLL